jgi:hypothetical protein
MAFCSGEKKKRLRCRIPSGRMAGAFRAFLAGAAFYPDETRKKKKLPFLMLLDCGRGPGAN